MPSSMWYFEMLPDSKDFKHGFCHGSLTVGWKRISRHRVFQKAVRLLRTKSRDNVGVASTVC